MLKWPLIVLAASWALCCAGLALEYQNQTGHVPGTVALFVVAGLPVVALRLAADRRPRWGPALERSFLRHTEAVDALSPAYDWLWIALAAGVGLYLELVIVRFHASCFQLFAFFKNFSLLSCFLGLGIGYAVGSRRPLATLLVLPLLAGQMVLLHALRFTDVGSMLRNPVSEHLALGLKQSGAWFHAAAVYGFLLFVFCFNALCFIPLGQLASRVMARRPRLAAYGWNLVGSLAGIALFFVASALWTPPVVWAALGVVALAVFLRGHLLSSLAPASVLLGMLGTSFSPRQYDVYSPYQILTVRTGREPHPEILVNHDYFQKIWDLSAGAKVTEGRLAQAARYYDLPYAFKPGPRDVLVVGSGTGNDVAAAVRNGAGRVDGVEIDPAILLFGRTMHPEDPYGKPNVRAIVNDARAHLRHTNQKYDLIVYGLLDSHTLLSGMGGVRLDSYVYTVDAFREARARLKPGGVIVLSFAMIRDALGRKLYLMLSEAFDGRPPVALRTGYDAGVAFVAGEGVAPGAATATGLEDVTAAFANEYLPADVSTDDWPFFYMSVRTYPVSYAVMIAALLAVAFVYVTRLMPAGDGAGAGGFSLPCFLLGAGFMLLETKAITELALFYGSTWVVVGVVIAAILVMAYVANLLVMKTGRIPALLAYVLLLASLAASLWLSYSTAAGGGAWATRFGRTAV
ncbi:MAG TPA: class I SAM-dependent methyltransferase, partial [Tepidisphaeraceae bacterium]|nr:class I SAM-dependent methyltransferase [Tepidisphaeraceae bacterium]